MKLHSLSMTLTNQAGAALGLKFSELVQACSNSVVPHKIVGMTKAK